MVIYKITNILNGKVYIGQTIRPLSHRWTQHLRDSNGVDYPLYRSMRKYGKEKFIVEIIDKAQSFEELNKKELEWISSLKSDKRDFGYNILPGGKRFKMPQEVRDKISKGLKGKKQKRYISKEERSRIAKENASKLIYDEKWLISNGSKPFMVYRAICKQLCRRNRPSIYEKGEYVGKWLSSTQCAKDLGISSKHIRSCLTNKRKQSQGFIFERIKEI